MEQHDPAARRFWILQMTRLSGAVMAMLGAVIVAQVIPLPEAAGGILLVLGAAEFFIVPHMLAKRWKSPNE